MSDNPITDEMRTALREVTTLETWCLATAVASVLAQGNEEVSQMITDIANSIYTSIAGDDSSDEE